MSGTEHAKSATKVVHRRSRWVLVGTATTAIAVVISLTIVTFEGFAFVDWLSPPFGIVGFVCCAYAVIEGVRPRGLAFAMFALSMAYWIFFCMGVAARS